MHRISITLEFKLVDLWIGLFWKCQEQDLHIWICLLPTLPIHIILNKGAN